MLAYIVSLKNHRNPSGLYDNKITPASCTIFVNFRANFMKFFHFHEDLAEDYQNPTSLKDVQYFKHLCSRLRVHKFILCKMCTVLSWANTSLFGRALRTDHPCLVIISYIGSSWGRAIVLGAKYFSLKRWQVVWCCYKSSRYWQREQLYKFR